MLPIEVGRGFSKQQPSPCRMGPEREPTEQRSHAKRCWAAATAFSGYFCDSGDVHQDECCEGCTERRQARWSTSRANTRVVRKGDSDGLSRTTHVDCENNEIQFFEDHVFFFSVVVAQSARSGSAPPSKSTPLQWAAGGNNDGP